MHTNCMYNFCIYIIIIVAQAQGRLVLKLHSKYMKIIKNKKNNCILLLHIDRLVCRIRVEIVSFEIE